MEISQLKVLLKNISRFLHRDDKCSDIVEKYYIKIEEVLKVVKPVLESIIDADVALNESLQKEFAGMSQSVNELREVLEDSHPLMSKVLKAESLFEKVQTHGLDLLDLLQSCELHVELSSPSVEHWVQKIKHTEYEPPSAIVSKAIQEQVKGAKPSAEIRSKIASLLSLRSNQELLIELVALENIKENAEQGEKIGDAYIEKMISLVTHMHDCFVEIKQSPSCNPVPIPPDLCCPLSLELMTDPVIVASGQTYERGCILDWIALGLTVCPKTMQTLVHSNLIPNYTVKALISTWCEANHVKLPDPVKSTSFNQPSSPIQQEEASLVHHVHSSSEDSMPEIPENGDELEERSMEIVITTLSTSMQRQQHEHSPRFRNRSRNQRWRRASERLVTETRPDLSGVETQVIKLVEDLSSTSFDAVKNATFELRLLARHDKDVRNVIANSGAITLLINLLHSPHQYAQENAVTALLNLSINDINRTAIGNANAIEPLIHVLKTGSQEAKENSAAALFSLTIIKDYKIKIGRSGAIEPLVDLLGNGTPRGKKDAATALFNLSMFHENKARIVQAGAVRFLVELMDPTFGLIDKAVGVLSNLATIPEGRTNIGLEGCIPMLVEVLELGSAWAKENAAAALLQLCTYSIRDCNIVLHNGAVPPLVMLSQSGTPRAKEKAQALLSYFRNQRHGNGGRR